MVPVVMQKSAAIGADLAHMSRSDDSRDRSSNRSQSHVSSARSVHDAEDGDDDDDGSDQSAASGADVGPVQEVSVHVPVTNVSSDHIASRIYDVLSPGVIPQEGGSNIQAHTSRYPGVDSVSVVSQSLGSTTVNETVVSNPTLSTVSWKDLPVIGKLASLPAVDLVLNESQVSAGFTASDSYGYLRIMDDDDLRFNPARYRLFVSSKGKRFVIFHPNFPSPS